MSKEEAIKYLKEMKDECNDTIHNVRYVTQEEALEMAIKALEQEPSGDMEEILEVLKCDADAETKCKMISNILNAKPHYFEKQEQSGDLISRQEVIDACEQSINILEAVDRIMDLPSVEQEPKTGHWDRRTCKCSECGYQITFSEYTEHKYKYCPNCGTRMVEPQESEDKE